MAASPPSTLSYLLASPIVLSTVARYAVHGSPHPALSLKDLIQAALFKHFAGQSLLPPNTQSSWDARMATKFSGSVTARAEEFKPLESKYYLDELSHPSVPPTSVPAFWLTPKKQLTPGVVLLYIHGGGYGRGDATGGGIANALANKLGRLTVSIDYRLGHTAPFPGAVQDCVTAYFTLRHAHGYRADQIVLVGESAGAGLCIALLLHLRTLHETPRQAILLSPLMQTRDTSAPSFSAFDEVDFISTAGLKQVVTDYVRLLPDSKYIQLFDNSYVGFPPLFVSYGDAEILCDDDRTFCARARADGVDVIEDVGVGRVHVWLALPQHQREAKPVWEKMKRFVDGPIAKL